MSNAIVIDELSFIYNQNTHLMLVTDGYTENYLDHRDIDKLKKYLSELELGNRHSIQNRKIYGLEQQSED